MANDEKPLIWLGDSLEIVQGFPKPVKRMIGVELHSVQNGLPPNDWKPMKTVGKGVRELRVRHGEIYRVLYITKISDSVHVLHAFNKKDQQTRQSDVKLAKDRLKQLRKELRDVNKNHRK